MLKVAGGGIGISGGLSYQGAWNASTNTPALASGVGTNGQYYVVSVAGTTDLDGITDWQIGDWAIFNGTAWQKIDNTDLVQSVNGQTGVVVLGATDVGAAPNTAYVNTTGLLSGGGQLTGNVTIDLTSVPVANVPGAVPNTVNVLSSGLLSGGGPLTGNVTISLASVPVANVSGLGTMATQNANNVSITGGNITGTVITQNATPTVAGMVFGETDPSVGLWSGTITNNGTYLYFADGGNYNISFSAGTAVNDAVNAGNVAAGQHMYIYDGTSTLDFGTIISVTPGNPCYILPTLAPYGNPLIDVKTCNTMTLVGTKGGNTALGKSVLATANTASYNTVIGFNAGGSLVSGNGNIIIGNNADASGDVSYEATIGTTSITKTRLYGAIAFNNSYGTSGQILVSQGNSAAPQWTAAANVSIGTANVANSTVGTLTLGTGLTGTSFNGSANVTTNLANTAVTAASYGSDNQVAAFTVDAQGRLTAASNVTIVATQANFSNTSSTVTFATSSMMLVPEGYITILVNGVNKKIPYYGV